MKKTFRIIFFSLLAIALGAILFLAITFPPVMSGMAAKTVCSCVFVTGRTLENVKAKELQVFPGLSSARFDLNEADSSVSATILGRTKKAIFRKGLGCTLLAERSEAEVRSQSLNLPPRAPKIDSLHWPSGNTNAVTVISGVNHQALDSIINDLFLEKDPKHPINTHAIVVAYDGKIIAEKYADGFNVHSRLMGWSMTKSVFNALIGILVKDGKLNVKEPAPITAWQNDDRRKITVEHLLHATSGLEWQESYFNPFAHFHNMFIKRDDKAGYAINLPIKNDPGKVFEYSSAATNTLSYIVRNSVGDERYYRFPYERLFHKIGMVDAILEPDAAGTFVGSSYCFASARDWTRLGLLYLNDGVWEGERILPEGWVTYSTTPSDAAQKREYGAQLWLNLGNSKNPSDSFLPGAPPDAYLFEGFERNAVVIIPSKKLVITRLGVTHNHNFSLPQFVNSVIETLPKE